MENCKYGRPLLALAVIILTSCGNSSKDDQPNFIVQNAQAVVTSRALKPPTETAKQQNADAKEEAQGFASGKKRQEPDYENEEADLSPGFDSKETDQNPDVDSKEVSLNLAAGNEGALLNPASDPAFSGEAFIMTVDVIKNLYAQDIVDIVGMQTEEIDACFYYEEISDAIFERIKGKSYKEDCLVPLSDLRYARVLHYGFDEQVHVGELVINQAIAQDIIDIFKELFNAKYPIEKMVLIDEYNGDNDASMQDNNTSSFHFCIAESNAFLSRYAYGLAVDINPLYNPYVSDIDRMEDVLPANAVDYTDRTTGCSYYILHGDVCYQAFVSRGFIWGGDWASTKSYQHFSKVLE